MSPLPDEQPLSRRQLREQQRTNDTTEPEATRSRRASTATPVAGGDIPAVSTPAEPAAPEPTLSTAEVTVLEEAVAQGKSLTRRQSRDLERARTASVAVVTPEAAAAAKAQPAPAVEAAAAPLKPTPVPVAKTKGNAPVPSASAAAADEKPKPVSSRLPSFIPAAAPAAVVEEDEIDVEAEAEGIVEKPARRRASYTPYTDAPVVVAEVDSDDDDVASQLGLADNESEEEPQLSSSFGKAVLAEEPKKDEVLAAELDAPFDQIIARGLEEAGGTGVGTSSLILPAMPSSGPLTGPLSGDGSVVVTGSIDLPASLGSTGQHPNHFDKSDIDAMFDADEDPRPATAGTPVSASRAVSTHTATRDVIAPPAPAKSNRLLLILAITAGVLAVSVLAVIIVGFAAGAFQSR